MASSVRFDIVDVFAERKYAGNQLAVIREAAALSHDEMQAIARETNFSETTFVVDDAPTVKVFTPREEIPFAGHPTLGTAAVLLGREGKEVTLQLKVGPIRVTRDDDGVLWMRQNPPTFGAKQDARTMAAILGVQETDLDASLPIEDVSTGLMHTIVPLARVEAVHRVKVDVARYWAWCERSASKSVLVFAKGARNPKNQLTVRVFPIYYGIAEDPATGSANGCLAGYLAKHTGKPVDARVEQGEDVGRPALIHLRANGSQVDVGGRVQHVVEGKLAR